MKRYKQKAGAGGQGEEAGIVPQIQEFRFVADGEEPTSLKAVIERALARGFSRRELLWAAGGGTAGLASAALLTDPAHAKTRERLQQFAARAASGIIAAATNPLSYLQLPVWGDGVRFDQPQYYTTIQAGRRLQANKTVQNADIDGDGQDELIARGPNGIIVQQFDPGTGQWLPLPNGPAWSDASSFIANYCYATIQTADIDGDGQAELLGWDGYNVQAWKYNATAQTWSQLGGHPLSGVGWTFPASYSTMQCADIDGDGADELLGRAPDADPNGPGVQVWKYSPATNSWSQLSGVTALSDANGWNQPQYYETIQCADVDGDGAWELLARNGNGIVVWKYNGAAWNSLNNGQAVASMSDGAAWNQPQYYQTIQCADVDGDGAWELLARNGDGIVVWKYASANQPWTPFNNGQAVVSMSDGASWNQPQYYQTIQCADIDGDGRAELIARNSTQVGAWKYISSSSAWPDMPFGPVWNDLAGQAIDNTAWADVQYYSTIQTARVKGDNRTPVPIGSTPVYPNLNNPPAGSANTAYAAVLGRSQYSLETWRFNPITRSWAQSSAPFPTFTGGQLTAYNYLNQQLRWSAGQNIDLRQRYASFTTGDATTYLSDLQGSPPLSPPPNVSEQDWTTVTDQIIAELKAVNIAIALGNSISSSLLVDITNQNGILDNVNNYLKKSVPSVKNSNWTIFVTIIEIIANAAWALSAFNPAVGVVTGLLAAGTIGLELIPGSKTDSPSYSPDELDALQADLHTAFTAAAAGNTAFTSQATQIWGLLQVQGEPGPSVDPATQPVLNAYEIYAAQKLSRLYWCISALTYFDFQGFCSDVQAPFFWDNGQGEDYYIGAYGHVTAPGSNCSDYQVQIPTSSAAMQRLFTPASSGGLNQSVAAAVQNQGGWDLSDGDINATDICGNGQTPPATSVLPRPRVPRLSVTAELARNAAGAALVSVVLKNVGNRSLTNIELTSVKLGNASASLDAGRTRLVYGKSETVHAVFLNPGPAGQKTTLTIKGKYKGGTFGGTYRVTVP